MVRLRTGSSAHLLTENEAGELMGPYRERVGDVIVRAVDRWQSLPPEHAASFSTRSRASVIHDYIVEATTVEFYADPHVTVTLKAGTCVLVFGSKVAVRFKKVRGTPLRCSMSTTWRQRAIHDQQLALNGTDVRPTWATAGYRLDAAGELAQTALVVAAGDSQQYSLDLDTAGTAAAAVLLPTAEDNDEGLVIRPAAAAKTAADGPATP